MNSDEAKILIVDDLPEKVLVLETILSDLEGVRIHSARSGEAALQQILENDFAVILLDVNMPGMDGFETASLIRGRKRSAHTPIIFVTAFTDEIQASRGYSLGAVDYILSPVVPHVLRSKVSVFIDLYRLTQQVRRQGEQQVQLAREQAARAAAESASQRATFLSEATRRLSSSLEAETIWQTLSRLAVPTLSEFCSVTRIDAEEKVTGTELIWCDHEGDIRAQHVDDVEELGGSLREAITKTLAVRTVVTLPFDRLDWPDEDGRQPDNEEADGERVSLVAIPLCIADRIVGVLTLTLGASPGLAFDMALAEDLAARAGIALENAGLCENIREAGRRKDEFLAMLAHELRNPLAPIRYAVEIFRLVGLTDQTLEQSLEMIDRQVSHMARLIDELLDFSRLSRGKILLRQDPVDLSEVVRTAADDLRSTLEENQLTLDVRLPTSPVVVQGDATRLAQVVSNILHNANKFTDPGGHVSVELAVKPNGTAALSIHDTGIGMEPAILERAFDSFTQADHSLDRSRGGLGLGLALVKQLVQLHGGDVCAASEGLGKGSQVMVSLPLSQQPAKILAPARPLPAHVDAKSLRVVIIEDNPDTAQSLRMVMALNGHKVAVANNGAQGLEVAREFVPDVVLCDIGLPGEFDGYAVAESLRRDFELSAVFLIATTGYGQDQDRRRARTAGFDAHLTKPVDPAELQRILATVSNRLVVQ